MPLDMQIEAMIQAARAAGARRPEQCSLAEARQMYTERYRARGVPAAPDVQISRLSIPGADGEIAARLYRPADAAGAGKLLPLLLYFHGGGFVLGDADAYEAQSTVLAARSNCMVLFPEFRLAPEHPFPAAVEDAIAIARWLATKAASLQADPQRLAVIGDSAGGNLAANVCIATRDWREPSWKLQCLLYPALDYRYFVGGPDYQSLASFDTGYWLDRSTREYFFARYFPRPSDAHDPRGSPMAAPDLSRLPPTVVLTAECDPLRDVGRAFFERLIAAGNDAEYRCVEGMVHNFFGHAGVSTAAARAVHDVADLLRARLHR